MGFPEAGVTLRDAGVKIKLHIKIEVSGDDKSHAEFSFALDLILNDMAAAARTH